MKIILNIGFVFLSTFSCFSQTQIIDSIPKDGIRLNNGWKFQSGDNPDYAKTGFDDKDWLNINIDQPLSQLPEKPLQKMSWYRLRFTFNSLLKDTLAALVIDQYGASEIYIDGHLI